VRYSIGSSLCCAVYACIIVLSGSLPSSSSDSTQTTEITEVPDNKQDQLLVAQKVRACHWFVPISIVQVEACPPSNYITQIHHSERTCNRLELHAMSKYWDSLHLDCDAKPLCAVHNTQVLTNLINDLEVKRKLNKTIPTIFSRRKSRPC
jgi:hypothetical protein